MSIVDYNRVVVVFGESDTVYATRHNFWVNGERHRLRSPGAITPGELVDAFAKVPSTGVAQTVNASGVLNIDNLCDANPWTLDWNINMERDVIPSGKLLVEAVSMVNDLLNDSNSKPTAAATTAAPVQSKPQPSGVPSVQVGDKTYYARWWGSVGEYDYIAVRKALRAGINVLLKGIPGCGKTMLTQAAAGPGLHIVSGSEGTDQAALLGQGNFNAQGQVVYEEGPFTAAAKHRHDSHCERDANGEIYCGKATVLFDEANGVDPRIAMLANPFTDGRPTIHTVEHGLIEVSPDFACVLNINPEIVGLELSPALSSRMGLEFEMLPDYSVGGYMGCSDELISWAEAVLRRKRNGEPVGDLPSLRLMGQHAEVTEIFGREVAWRNLMGKANPASQAAWIDAAETEVGISIPDLADGLLLA